MAPAESRNVRFSPAVLTALLASAVAACTGDAGDDGEPTPSPTPGPPDVADLYAAHRREIYRRLRQ